VLVTAYAVAAPSWPTARAATARFRRRWPDALPSIADDRVFFDAGGTTALPLGPERPAFRRLLAVLARPPAAGALVVSRFEALGRSTRDIEHALEAITARFDLAFVCDLDDDAPLLLDDDVRRTLHALRTAEHRGRSERTMRGQLSARRAGKTIGRPSRLDDAACRRVREDLRRGASVRATAAKFGVAEGTIRNVRNRALEH
jgi:putative DNA-invertase from lambdoid prophage Rac